MFLPAYPTSKLAIAWPTFASDLEHLPAAVPPQPEAFVVGPITSILFKYNRLFVQ